MPRERLEWRFPNLARQGYSITSDPTPIYNCVAWAVGESDRWYEPGGEPGFFWPDGVSQDGSLEEYTAVFFQLGYELCESHDWEASYEKVAIYADEDGEFCHVARTTPAGTWSSKLGALEDIEHNTLTALEGVRYGHVFQVLRRPLRRGSETQV